MLSRRENVFHFASLLSSTYGAVIISFFTNILITKMLNKEDYASYKYIIYIISMMCSFSNLGVYYSSARILAIHEKKEKPVYGATIIMMLLISLAAAFVTLGIGLFMKQDFQEYKWAAFLGYTVILQRTFIYMLKGSKKIADISIQHIVPQVIQIAIWAGIYFAGIWKMSFREGILIYGIAFTATHILSVFRIGAVFDKSTFAHIRFILKEHRHTGLQIYFGSLSTVFVSDFLNVFLGAITNRASYASYALALSFSTLLMEIPSSIATISFAKNALRTQIERKEAALTITISMIGFVLYNILMRIAIPLIYDDAYNDTMQYIPYLSFGYLLHGFGDYVNNFLNARGFGKEIRNAVIIVGVLQLLLSILIIPGHQINGLIFVRIATSIMYLMMMVIAYKKSVKKQIAETGAK